VSLRDWRDGRSGETKRSIEHREIQQAAGRGQMAVSRLVN
jgi:hypothetical protein